MKNFKKYENNPVFGDKNTGTVFDSYVCMYVWMDG